jgi:hypothetical protein
MSDQGPTGGCSNADIPAEESHDQSTMLAGPEQWSMRLRGTLIEALRCSPHLGDMKMCAAKNKITNLSELPLDLEPS